MASFWVKMGMCIFWWLFRQKNFLSHFYVLRPPNSDFTLKTDPRVTFWPVCHKAPTVCMENGIILGQNGNDALFCDIFAKKIFCDIFPSCDLQIRILRWKLILGWHFGQFATKRRRFAWKTTSFWVKIGMCTFWWHFCEKNFLWHFSVLRPQNSDSTLKTNSRMTFWSFCHKAQMICMQNDFILGQNGNVHFLVTFSRKKFFVTFFRVETSKFGFYVENWF